MRSDWGANIAIGIPTCAGLVLALYLHPVSLSAAVIVFILALLCSVLIADLVN